MTPVALKTVRLGRERLAYYARNDRGISLSATQNVINLLDAIIDNAIDALSSEHHVHPYVVRLETEPAKQ